MDDTKKALLSIELDTAALTQNAEKAKEAVKALAEQLKELKAAGKESGEAFDKVVEQLKKAGEEAEKSNKSLKEFTTGLTDASKAAGELKTGSAELAKQHGDAANETSKYSKTLKEYGKDLAEAAQSHIPMAKSIGDAAKDFKAFREVTSQAGEALVGYGSKIKDVVKNYQDHYTSARSVSESFGLLSTGSKIASDGLSLLGKGFKGLGIGLVITAFASLMDYLKQVTPLVDFVEQKTAFLSGAFNTLGRIVFDLTAPLKKLFTDPKQACIDLVEFIGNNLLNRVKAFGVIVDAIASGNLKDFANGVLQLGSGITNLTDKISAHSKVILKAGEDTEKLKVEQQALARSTEGEALKAQDTELKILELQKKARSGNMAQRREAQKEIAVLQSAKTKLHKDNIDKRVELSIKEIGIKRGLTQQEIELIKTKGLAEIEALKKQGKIYDDDVKLYSEAAGKKFEWQIEYEKKKQAITDNGHAKNKKNTSAEKPKPTEVSKTDDTEAKAKAAADQEIRDQKELYDLKVEETLKGEKRLDEIYKVRTVQIIKDQEFDLKNAALTETQRQIIKQKYASKQKELDNDYAETQKNQAATTDKLAKAEQKTIDTKLNKYKSYFSQVQGLFAKHTIAAKAAFVAQKAIASAEVAITTEQSVAKSILATKNAIAIDSSNPFPLNVALVAKDIALGVIDVASTIAAGVKQIATINSSNPSGFARGGLYLSDGNGAYLSGPGSGTSDSINAKLSNGESIINARSTQMFAPVLSAINQAGGGRAFNTSGNGNNYALGGIFSGSNIMNDGSTELAQTRALNDMARVMAANMPRQILVVEDVQAGLQNKAMLQSMSNF